MSGTAKSVLKNTMSFFLKSKKVKGKKATLFQRGGER
jgi:hypothetical protein